MRLAICDDQPAIIMQIEDTIDSFSKDLFEIETYNDPQKMLNDLKVKKFDAFFLDIEFPSMNGVEVAEVIRKSDYTTPIIFITSYREYMDDVFRLHTFDYLIKPIDMTQMHALLRRLTQYLKAESRRFFFSFNKISHSLLLSEILYFEKDRRNVTIYTDDDEYQVIMSTKELLDLLPKDFIQVHASYIVNIEYLTKIDKQKVYLHSKNGNDIEIPLSRRFSKDIRNIVIKNLRGIL